MKPKLNETDFQRGADALGCPVSRVKAVTAVEARGNGFDDADRPIILFERHKFHKFTNGAYDDQGDISSSEPGGYTRSNASEHARLEKAAALDREAALQSASWGLFQIMGFNWQSAGFPSLQSFINAMYSGEGSQLDAFVGFVKDNHKLLAAIQKGDAVGFASNYNGASYAINKYDTKLKAAGF